VIVNNGWFLENSLLYLTVIQKFPGNTEPPHLDPKSLATEKCAFKFMESILFLQYNLTFPKIIRALIFRPIAY
jgi:hypothetical protein